MCVRGISFGMPVVPPESWKIAGSVGSIAISASRRRGSVAGRLDQRRRARRSPAGASPSTIACLSAGLSLPDALDHRGVVEIARAVGSDARRRAGELDELADLGEAMRDQRRDRDRADLLQREIEDHELGDVRELHDDAVERLQAELEQVQREVRREAVEFGVGDSDAVAVDAARRVRRSA